MVLQPALASWPLPSCPAGGAFPPGVWAAFAVWRLAEDVRTGQVSRWSDLLVPVTSNPEALAEEQLELQCLRKDVGEALAVARSCQGGTLATVSDTFVTHLEQRLEVLTAARARPRPESTQGPLAGSHAGPGSEDPMLRALAGLIQAIKEAISRPAAVAVHARERASVPRWCDARPAPCAVPRRCSTASLNTTRVDAQLPTASVVEGPSSAAEVDTAVVAYCSALRDCLASAQPGYLRVPQRTIVALLPPHLRETASEIYTHLVWLRSSIDPDGGPTAREERVLQTKSAGAELASLLARLAVQASAAGAVMFTTALDAAVAEAAAAVKRCAPEVSAATTLPSSNSLSPAEEGLGHGAQSANEKLPFLEKATSPAPSPRVHEAQKRSTAAEPAMVASARSPNTAEALPRRVPPATLDGAPPVAPSLAERPERPELPVLLKAAVLAKKASSAKAWASARSPLQKWKGKHVEKLLVSTASPVSSAAASPEAKEPRVPEVVTEEEKEKEKDADETMRQPRDGEEISQDPKEAAKAVVKEIEQAIKAVNKVLRHQPPIIEPSPVRMRPLHASCIPAFVRGVPPPWQGKHSE